MADSPHPSDRPVEQPGEESPGDKEHLLEEEPPHPRGTMVILLIYLTATIGFWGFIYSMLFYGG